MGKRKKSGKKVERSEQVLNLLTALLNLLIAIILLIDKMTS